MKFRDVIKMMEADGWFLARTNGSHRIYQHPTKSGSIPGLFTVWETTCLPA